MIALDSSALVELVVDEPESAGLESWLTSRAPLSVTAGDLAPGRLVVAFGGLLVLGVLMRLLVGATVRGAAGSLLAAGIVHATFNAANNEGSLVDDLLAGGQPSLSAVVAAVLFTAGALLALRNRR